MIFIIPFLHKNLQMQSTQSSNYVRFESDEASSNSNLANKSKESKSFGSNEHAHQTTDDSTTWESCAISVGQNDHLIPKSLHNNGNHNYSNVHIDTRDTSWMTCNCYHRFTSGWSLIQECVSKCISITVESKWGIICLIVAVIDWVAMSEIIQFLETDYHRPCLMRYVVTTFYSFMIMINIRLKEDLFLTLENIWQGLK